MARVGGFEKIKIQQKENQLAIILQVVLVKLKKYLKKNTLKKTMKKILIILAIILLTIAAYWAWLKFSPNKFLDGFYLVPQDALMVIETEDPIKNWQTFSSSTLWQGLKTFPKFAEITKNADVLDEVIKQNQQIFSLLGQRHLLISVHMTKAKDYDFVYYADMKEASKSSIVKSGLVTIVKQFGYKHTVRNYFETEINEFFDAVTRETMYISFVNNYMVISYNKGLLEKVITTSKTPASQLGSDLHFTEVNQLTAANGLCRIFINYQTFHQYLGVYIDDVSDVKDLFSSLHFSGLNCIIDNDKLLADGYSMVNDSISSYLQALSISGKSTTNSEKVFSNKSSFYLSMGFKDFNTFYSNLSTIWQKDATAYAEQQANIKKIEKLLNINLQKNMFDWIGSEIAIAQYETDVLIGNKLHNIMAIKANDISDAKENLDIIEAKIRKRTPLKFKTVNYNGYDIKYIEVKGLFKAFLGKLFSKIDKPYYTIIDDYVVMSDDPKSLLVTIDDYIAQNTITNRQDYRDFRDKFPSETSILTYMSPDRHFANFKGLLNAESWKSTKKTPQYVRCFTHFGLSLSGDGDRMCTVIGTQYSPYIEKIATIDTNNNSENDTLTAMDLFLIANFQNDMNATYYENGQVKTLTEIDDKTNQADGIYAEYYENGVIKIKGKYRKGTKDGTWKYYKSDSEFDYKEKYNNGELKEGGFLNRLFGNSDSEEVAE